MKIIVVIFSILMLPLHVSADTVMYAGSHFKEMDAKSVKAYKIKPGGHAKAMFYDVNTGRYFRSVGNIARTTASASVVGLVLVGIYEAAAAYGTNQQVRDFTSCNIARTISFITGRDIYDDDC